MFDEEAAIKMYLKQYIRDYGYICCAECRQKIQGFRYRSDVGAVCIPCDGALDIAAQSPNGGA